MSWQPNEEGIKQVLTMLKDSTSPDSAVQKQVTMVRNP
jgi:hypothetical protein